MSGYRGSVAGYVVEQYWAIEWSWSFGPMLSQDELLARMSEYFLAKRSSLQLGVTRYIDQLQEHSTRYHWFWASMLFFKEQNMVQNFMCHKLGRKVLAHMRIRGRCTFFRFSLFL